MKIFIVMPIEISTESLTVLTSTNVEVREGDDSIMFFHLSGSASTNVEWQKITEFYQRGGNL